MDPEIEVLIEESTIIDAPTEQVWALVSDPRLMRRWSPQVFSVRLRSPEPIGVGTRTLNINRSGLLVWTTRSQVVSFDVEKEFAWKIRDNRSIWSFHLEPEGDSQTRLVQRRETPNGLTDRAMALERRFMGGLPAFQAKLRDGMRTTLGRIRATAEAEHQAASGTRRTS